MHPHDGWQIESAVPRLAKINAEPKEGEHFSFISAANFQIATIF